MLLVAVEALALALAAVPHFGVLNRVRSVCRRPLAKSHPSIRRFLPVLPADLHQPLDVWPQWILDRELILVNPSMQRCYLASQNIDGVVLLFWITPVDVQSGLDAGMQQQGDTRSTA